MVDEMIEDKNKRREKEIKSNKKTKTLERKRNLIKFKILLFFSFFHLSLVSIT